MDRRRSQLTIVAGMVPLFACAVTSAPKVQSWHLLLLVLAVVVLSAAVWAAVLALRDDEKAKTRQLAEVYKDLSEALASAVAAKDSYEQNHVRRVVAICDLISTALKLKESDSDGIRIAALVHDAGKLGVPDYIMLKPGPLDTDEFSKMRNHTAIGAKILEQVHCPWDIVGMVKHHHENYDGTGYPEGISGDQIPLGSRIISVAEVYDALVSDRCYKQGWEHQDAIEYITKLSGTHFDPAVVEAFLGVADQVTECYSSVADDEQSHKIHVEKSCAAADEIARANQELVSLCEIAQTLSSTLELGEVLGLLAQRTRRLLQASTCVVFLTDERNPGKLMAKAATGRHSETADKASVTKGMGATGNAYIQCKPFIGEYDPSDMIVGENARRGLKSCMVVPIVKHGRAMGTINVYDDSPNAFSADDLHLLTSVADRAALAIQNARAFEHVRDSAMRDPLTGLHNSRHLRGDLDMEIRRAHRQHQPVSVLMVDLDNFKAINDTMGHQAGDTVLQQSAGILLAQLRDYDHVARVGGDEFMVMLPGTPADEAELIAERIRRGIESYARKALSASSAPLGASVGVASYPNDAEDLDALLARADAAMYDDKRAHKQERLAA